MGFDRRSDILLYSILILLPAFAFLLFSKKLSSKKLPPGPPGWPVFGHLFSLGTLPHRTIAGLREKYGPVVWLWIGSTNTMAILSANAAAEFFKNHDETFLDRSIVDTMKSHDYWQGSMALAPYGAFWRLLKRICTTEMLVNRRINDTVALRRKCVNDMLSFIERDSVSEENEGGIHLARYIFLANFNMLGNLLFSRDLADPESDKASDFFNAMMGIMEWAGTPNISDLFPWLSWLDLQGLRKKMDRDIGKALRVASTFVQERIKEREKNGKTSKDFLDVMLNFEGNGKDEPAKLSERDINLFTMEIFLAGSESTSASIEWALTELLHHPEQMTKVKAEIAKVVGPNRRLEESDIGNLPYLLAVTKETLRLHPPIPFLVPRRATEDTKFLGYNIPKNTQVFVNTWAIGRDPDYWKDADSFKPERFLGTELDYKGQHFELIPFGAGRRMCAGYSLAHRMLHLLLGSVLHEFDWEPVNLDMRERSGITVRKLEPLRAIPRKCLV